ncbi:hypothetical protein M0Q50_09855 [bacterium]|jgi:hypothetical protein|nr:hypothetical protein [bacterium]
MEDFIYIITIDGSTQMILSVFNSYNKSIIGYYNITKSYENFGSVNYCFLYKIPINIKFYNDDINFYDNIKLQKSCKYRVKYENFDKLELEYNKIIRLEKLKSI